MPVARALRGETVDHFEYQFRTEGMEAPRWVSTSAAPVVDPDSTPPVQWGAVAVIRDVTEERRLARVKDEFFSIASHELKTPLTTIKGLAQLLSRIVAREGQIDRERTAHNLGVILRQIDRMAGLVEDMLDVTRIQAGRLRLRPAPLDLVQLAAEVVERFREGVEAAAAPQIALESDLTALDVFGDAVRIDQVLTNLLSNALKYAPAGGPVSVRLARTGDEARLTVCDRGVGLDAATHEHLFEPYFRAPAAHGRVPGLGLGLYIARSIVEQHGGRIWAESDGPDLGTCFHVALPVDGPGG